MTEQSVFRIFIAVTGRLCSNTFKELHRTERNEWMSVDLPFPGKKSAKNRNEEKLDGIEVVLTQPAMKQKFADKAPQFQ